jgi:anti-sigma-K factor RskA
MTDTNDHSGLPPVPDDEWLAAEVALGVLVGAERAQAAQRMAREPGFAARVAAWDGRLAPWSSEIAEVVPPPQVWEAIAAQLPAAAVPRAGLWQSLALWRGLALASGALAAACVAALLYFGTATPSPPPLVAAIAGGGKPVFVATVDRRRATVAVVPAGFSADATRVPELWLIPAGGKPLPLGVLHADRPISLSIPPALMGQTAGGAVLAVSLEPPGGSPTGAPTGPVIGTGKLTSL